MSNVVVYVFLLDNLTSFNSVLNETLLRHTQNTTANFIPIIGKCDSEIAEKIFNAITTSLDQQILPIFRKRDNNYLTASNDVSFDEKSQEKINNDLSEYTLREQDREEPVISFNNYSKQLNQQHFSAEINSNQLNETEISRSVYPENAPFLVAIFETLSNITAQTCAGTLIAPHWVLTAASCINILSKLYSDNKDMMGFKSSYTVVAGVSDPLLDGLVHNVTTIVEYQDNNHNSSKDNRNGFVEVKPYLVMLKIVPEIRVTPMPIIEEEVTKGEVMIYGWVMAKDELNSDTFVLISISALMLNTSECQQRYGCDRDVICLSNKDTDKNITELSSGGPVLMLQGGEMRMLAVVQTDVHMFIGYPLHVYYNWIKFKMNDKS